MIYCVPGTPPQSGVDNDNPAVYMSSAAVNDNVERLTALALVASAIAGRSLSVVSLDLEYAYTDGLVIYLPTGEVDQQLAGLFVLSILLSGQSLKSGILRSLVGKKSTACRYVNLELRRQLPVVSHLIPRRLLEQLYSQATQVVSTSAEDSLRLARLGRVAEAPLHFGRMLPSKILANNEVIGLGLSASNVSESAVQRNAKRDLEQTDENDDTEESVFLRLFSGPGMGENFITKFLKENILDMSRSPSQEKSDACAGSDYVENLSVLGNLTKKIEKISQIVTSDLSTNLPVYQWAKHYPEWDVRKQRYRNGWCSVVELEPALVAAAGEVHFDISYEFKRQFARIGLSMENHSRLRDGHDLDFSALVDYGVMRAAGQFPEERIYTSRMRTGHDLSVLVLIDCSGSTADQQEGQQSIWSRQQLLAANLIVGLEEAGDRVASYGFRSHGRKDVRYLRIKDFNHRFDLAAKSRLHNLQPSGFTRLGAAIRHGSKLVETCGGTQHRLLVLISDGVPYEDDYQGRYAQEDTRMALAEAVDRGVACLCLSVGGVKDEQQLAHTWGEVGCCRVVDLDAFSTSVEVKIRAALKQVLEKTYGKGTGVVKSAGFSRA